MVEECLFFNLLLFSQYRFVAAPLKEHFIVFITQIMLLLNKWLHQIVAGLDWCHRQQQNGHFSFPSGTCR